MEKKNKIINDRLIESKNRQLMENYGNYFVG